ncbi:DUF4190 domain-containing protein [Thalassobacillus sp. CUG 92003]|uniref:DUF4190 domain-containing protein n=1 Tax=Thalassobacillus sp. CUG 92003 TaxID=2736641 RepID=UPI0015E6A19F|nr:DUF4190 domain-containing protein [Thalassobacillus sp. CUG 92003]
MIEKTASNSHSTTPLTLGILSIVIPFIGLVLGVIGVVVSRKASKEASNSFVTIGLICSVVGIVVQLFAILGFISYYMMTATG